MRDAVFGRKHLQLGEIEAGRKMLAFGVEHDRPYACWQRAEEGLEPENRRVVERIALLRACERDDRDRAAPLDLQGFRQPALRHGRDPDRGLLWFITFSLRRGQPMPAAILRDATCGRLRMRSVVAVPSTKLSPHPEEPA